MKIMYIKLKEQSTDFDQYMKKVNFCAPGVDDYSPPNGLSTSHQMRKQCKPSWE